jgi:hypothetical protein
MHGTPRQAIVEQAETELSLNDRQLHHFIPLPDRR